MIKWIRASIRRKVIFFIALFFIVLEILLWLLISYSAIRADLLANHIRNASVSKNMVEELNKEDLSYVSGLVEDFCRNKEDLYSEYKEDEEGFRESFLSVSEDPVYKRLFEQITNLYDKYLPDSIRLTYADFEKGIMFTWIESGSGKIRVTKIEEIKAFDDGQVDAGRYELIEEDTDSVSTMAYRLEENEKNGHMLYMCQDSDIEYRFYYSSFAIRTVLYISLILAVIVCIVTLILVDFKLTRPLNQLSRVTGKLVDNIANEEKQGRVYDELKINTGDEIEHLYDSIITMERGIYDYMDRLKKVTADKERIAAELDIARTIQAEMLPDVRPDFENQRCFDLAAYMCPAKEVGGDFYDFFMVSEDKLAFLIADVSGKGVPAAMVMAIGKTVMKDAVNRFKSISLAMDITNNILIASNKESMFITMYGAILNLRTGDLCYCNAGHPFPILIQEDGKTELLVEKGVMALGILPDKKYEVHMMNLKPGERLFLYTDGVTETNDSNEKLFGEDRCLQSLREVCKGKPSEILDKVHTDLDEFAGTEPQFDDTTMLCLEFKEYYTD